MLEQRIQQQFFDSADLKYAAAETLTRPIVDAVHAILGCITSGGKVLAGGNGASALLAQHLVGQLVDCFERERPALAALALGGDTALLSRLAGNQTFEGALARQIQALGHPGDVLVLLCHDEGAPNLLAAIEAAHEKDMIVVALTGAPSGALSHALAETDVSIAVAHQRAARVLEAHLLVIHCLCEAVDLQLLGDL